MDFVRDPDGWGCGPTFDTEIRLVDRPLRDLPAEAVQSILEHLDIDGAYGRTEWIGDRDHRASDWRALELAYGCWHLDQTTAVGVLMLPALPHHVNSDCDLAVPAVHVNHVFGEYPWFSLEEGVTEDVVRLHRLVIDRVMNLHRHVPVECVVIRDEAWPCLVKPTDQGVFVAKEIGLALGLEGEVVKDELHCMPLSECEGGL